MKTQPQLTIGLPVYNGEQYLASTIDSLLNQSFTDFELLIADNASTDSTLDLCREYARQDSRVRLMPSEVNRGAAWNFNRTFHESNSKYFKWAAHDDLHAPDFISKCIDALESNPEAVLAFTGTEFIDSKGDRLGEYHLSVDTNSASKRELFRLYACGGHIVHEIFGVIRSSALHGTPLIGGYVGSDLILLGRLALAGRFVKVPDVLFYHREHAGRSTVATGGDQGFTNWYDASKSGRLAAPHWRRARESLKSIWVHPMPINERLAHASDVARGAYWGRKEFLREIKQLLRQIVGYSTLRK